MSQKLGVISFYSEETRKFYKLLPTETWPALIISGVKMHRTDRSDPKKDTIDKMRTLGRIHGIVLDTCMGLGYTAIFAARKIGVEEVITFERDKNVIDIAKQNPYSKELFENPKIKLVNKDVFDGVKEFPENHFDFVVHDPPRFSLSSEIYSLEFYKQLRRVLKPKGKTFHYIGTPGSRYRGKNYLRGVVNRLQLAGFGNIKKFKEIGSLTCGGINK